MQSLPSATPSLDDVLRRINAKLDASQVRALFLGAHASTSLRLGPQHLLEDICGPSPVLGDDVADANVNLQSLMAAWNGLIDDHRAGRLHLSRVPIGNPPQREELQELTQRRLDEITWFLRGIDAGRDDPMEFGAAGAELFRRLAEASVFLERYQDLLGRLPEADYPDAGRMLEEMTIAIERIIGDLITVGADVRRAAIAESQQHPGMHTNRMAPVRAPAKVGRNAPCPCGSGRKWKRCCGSPTSVH